MLENRIGWGIFSKVKVKIPAGLTDHHRMLVRCYQKRGADVGREEEDAGAEPLPSSSSFPWHLRDVGMCNESHCLSP